MTSVLNLTTLGGLDIRLDGEPIPPLASRKADALLVYLAQTGRAHPREALAEMFWDDQPLPRSLSNLSVLLSSFRKTLPGFVQADRNAIWLAAESHVQLDARFLETPLNEARKRKLTAQGLDQETAHLIEQALAVFKGSFLEGFLLRDGRGFEEWAALEREKIHLLVFDGLSDLSTFYLNQGDYGYGLQFARRLLTLDPLREETHRQVMLLLARNGQRPQALEQYAACQQILSEELGLDPSPETTNLYRRIREAGQGKVTLPPQINPFVGRENELALIASRLANPACRLLTLTGPGGVGKTRLTLEAARLNEQAFLNGIVFIPLESVESSNLLVSTIATALGFSFFGREAPLQQLIHFLEEKELLLILDNFEQLLPSAHILDELLQHAPHVKILVTSRERLNLRAEWLLEIGGLLYRPGDALTLFEQHAQRVQAEFVLDEKNTSYVLQVCQLVDGFPLGIELASSWVRVLSPAEIAEEIARSVDFLASSLRDVPARHRSMRAVFDHSWNQLTEREQHVFNRLYVFRGAFRREAAREVAEASLHVLASLADKSLIQSQNGVYTMHELTRHYAAAQLSAHPEAQRATESAFTTYFAHFLAQRRAALYGGNQQRATLLEISHEIHNLRAAWNNAVADKDIPLLELALEPFARFLEMRSWYQEGLEMTGHAVNALTEPPAPADSPLAAHLLYWQGKFHMLLGQSPEAEKRFEASRARLEGTPDLYWAASLSGLSRLAQHKREPDKALGLIQQAVEYFEKIHHPHGKAEVLMNRGDYAREQGDFSAALADAEEALTLYRILEDEWSQARCLSTVGSVYGALGEYTRAREYFERGLAICQAIEDKYGVARNAHNLSNIHYFNEDFSSALQLRKMALEICRDIGFEWGIASSLQHVGAVELQIGHYAEASSYYRESLRRFQALGENRSVAYGLNMLGNLTFKQGEAEKALKYYRQGLSIALDLKTAPVILAILAGLTNLLKQQPHTQTFAYALLSYVYKHPGAEQQTRDFVPAHLQEIFLSPDEKAAAERLAQDWQATEGFSQVVEETLKALS